MALRAVAGLAILMGFCLTCQNVWGSTQIGATRMISTNMAQSAPLNLVNRWFARLESTLDPSWSTERLTFRSYRYSEINNPEKTIVKLLNDISGGPDEVRILELTPLVPTESTIRQTLDQFLNSLNFRPGTDETALTAQESLRAAVKAALARPDVLIHSARILRANIESRVLILIDNETKDLVLFALGSESH